MTTPFELFDPDLLDLHRARAARAPADFLHEAVAEELTERLLEVNRTFHRAALIGPRATLWAARLATAGVRAPLASADKEVLDLETDSLDLVVHCLALHWANDPVGQLVQCRRALRSDGLFLGALFGGDTLTELRQALAAAEVEEAGGLSPRVAPMGEIRELGTLLQRAGLALPVADSVRFDVIYPDALALMRDLRSMGETNVLRSRLRTPTRRAVIARAAQIYSDRFPAPEGRVRATFEVVVLTGWAPSTGQPKPLRPGSARMRLKDALESAERPSDDGERG